MFRISLINQVGRNKALHRLKLNAVFTIVTWQEPHFPEYTANGVAHKMQIEVNGVLGHDSALYSYSGQGTT